MCLRAFILRNTIVLQYVKVTIVSPTVSTYTQGVMVLLYSQSLTILLETLSGCMTVTTTVIFTPTLSQGATSLHFHVESLEYPHLGDIGIIQGSKFSLSILKTIVSISGGTFHSNNALHHIFIRFRV